MAKKKKTTSKRKTAKKKRIQKKKKHSRKQHWWQKKIVLPKWLGIGIIFVLCSLAAVYVKNNYVDYIGTKQSMQISKPEITENFLPVNSYSRPGIAIGDINGVVVHYVANPGSSAEENREYFEGLKDTHTTKASSHFIIGLEGEIIQCIPLDEISYASNGRNGDTISIECCHPDEDGKFNEKTYDSLVNLVSWLCEEYGLSSEDVIRHYDVTGKLCPIYYVEHEDKWTEFRQEIEQKLKNY